MDAREAVKFPDFVLFVFSQSLAKGNITFLLNFLEANWIMEPSLRPQVKVSNSLLNLQQVTLGFSVRFC